MRYETQAFKNENGPEKLDRAVKRRIEIINVDLNEEDFALVKIDLENMQREFIENLKGRRVEITPEQENLLHSIDTTTQDILLRYGIELPDENFAASDIIPLSREDIIDISRKSREMTDYPKMEGLFIPLLDQAIIYYKKHWEKNQYNRDFVHVATHEIMHAKSFLSLQIFKKENGEVFIEGHKSGLQEMEIGNPKIHSFEDLNEAITEMLTVEVANEVISKLKHEQIVANNIEKAKKLFRGSDKPQRIDEAGKIMESHLFSKEDVFQYELPAPIYEKNCDILRQIIEEISRRLSMDEKKVKSVFYKAYFEGDNQELESMIDEALSENTFDIIATEFFSEKLQKRLKSKDKKSRLSTKTTLV